MEREGQGMTPELATLPLHKFKALDLRPKNAIIDAHVIMMVFHCHIRHILKPFIRKIKSQTEQIQYISSNKYAAGEEDWFSTREE